MISKISTRVLPAFLLSCLITVLLNSCQKEERFGLDPQVQPRTSLLGKSRVFFEKNILRQAQDDQRLQARPKALRHRVAKTPLWHQAVKVQLSIGEGLKVPLAYSEEINLLIGPNKEEVPLADLSYLLLYKDRQQQWKAEVVTQIPDAEYWIYRHQLNRSFCGMIIVEDWWGRPLKCFKKTAQKQIIYLDNPQFLKSQKENSPQLLDEEDCEFVVTKDARGMYNLEIICQPVGRKDMLDVPGDSGGGGSTPEVPDFPHGNNSPDPDEYPNGLNDAPGGGGNGVPEPPDGTSDIENNLPEGCLRNVVNELIQKDCVNQLSSMINQIFNVSPELDLIIDGRATFPNDVDGDASTQLGGDGYCKINIDLNLNILPGAAKEYIAATMFHEAIHAYLAANSIMSDLDHQLMAASYISKMAKGIQELYPSISLSDAEALAWGGLQETSAWTNLRNSDPVRANTVLQTNINYRNGNVGNVCEER